MKDSDFQKLLLGVKQMGDLMRGDPAPGRETRKGKEDLTVKQLRESTKLSQSEFAKMIGVSARTLQNWEQGRREPDGPAKALLRVVAKNPKAVLAALHAA